ncbi:hypothetical protein HELRODRAFT_177182 [Helobdella robusta]|uniref:EGF-like domain-containing protein n=1 Tax=Helobdella robusta TaxID=6412 RepID=T1FBC0_HELRO|nr:hypothetical protein HELRODRAFT_177182 [Helobdella robusta]ESN98300.1 hypothetical protein HELRODRAFT_177182 [Helobdella robusta]
MQIERDPTTENMEAKDECPCKNGGTCANSPSSAEVLCNCTMTSLTGTLCDDDSLAYEFTPKSIFMYLYPQNTKPNTFIDTVVFGLITSKMNVTFLSIRGDTSNDFTIFYLQNGSLNVEVSLEKKESTVRSKSLLSDGSYHIVRYQRIGSSLSLQVDTKPKIFQNRSESHKPGLFRNQAMIIAGHQLDPRFASTFSGIIAGLYVNGLLVFDPVNQNRSSAIGNVYLKNNFNRLNYSHDGSDSSHWLTVTTRRPKKFTKPRQDELIKAKHDPSQCPVYDKHLLDSCNVDSYEDDDSFIRPTIEINRMFETVSKLDFPEVTDVGFECTSVSCLTGQTSPNPLNYNPKPAIDGSIETSSNVPKKYSDNTSLKELPLFGTVYKFDQLKNAHHDKHFHQQNNYHVRYNDKNNEYAIYDNFLNDTSYRNYYLDNPDYVISSIFTNIILTVGISISFIILVLVLIYAIRKCSQTKVKENETLDQLVPELRYNPKTSSVVTSNVHVRHVPELSQSLLRDKPICENYVKEWFI